MHNLLLSIFKGPVRDYNTLFIGSARFKYFMNSHQVHERLIARRREDIET
jgi:hypothetical protein